MFTGIIVDFGSANNAHEANGGYTRAASRLGRAVADLYAALYSGPRWNAAIIDNIRGAEYWRRAMLP